MVQTCVMAGGATSAPCTDRRANSVSVYTGFVSPIASAQLRIIGRFTGSLASRGLLSPAAAIRPAARSIAGRGPRSPGRVPAARSLRAGSCHVQSPPFTGAPAAARARPSR